MDNKLLKKLKTQKQKLLNTECLTLQKFEEIQEELNSLEFKIKKVEKEVM